MKGMRLEIYTSSYGSYSNGGISSKCKGVTLVGEGVAEVFEANEEYPAVVIKTRDSAGEEYSHVEPLEARKEGFNGPMAGGCVVWSSDSRVRALMKYPMSLHDRYEEWE